MRWLLFLVLIITSLSLFGQHDTARQIEVQFGKSDSLTHQWNHAVDSVQLRLNKLSSSKLSVPGAETQLSKRKARRDSIRFFKQLQREKEHLQNRIEHLSKTGAPVDKEVRQLDSLNRIQYRRRSDSSGKQDVNSFRQSIATKTDSLKQAVNPPLIFGDSIKQSSAATIRKINDTHSKIEATEQKLNQPIDNLENKVNEKLDLMNKEGGTQANLPGDVNIPDQGIIRTELSIKDKLDLPSANGSLPNTLTEVDNPVKGEWSDAAGKISEMKEVPQQQMDRIKSIEEVSTAQGKLTQANALTDKVQSYSGDVKKMTEGNLNEMKEIPSALENKAGQLSGVDQLKKEAAPPDEYKAIAEKAKDPEALRQEAIRQGAIVMMDHFAGNEAALQAAIDKLSKLKSKHAEFPTLKDLPKRRINEMRGKPFIERIVPGITLQIQKTTDVLIDYNPYMGYRITGPLTVGFGWNERFGVGKHLNFSVKERIYGPRIFVDLKVWKGFSLHTDLEKMNTYIPALASGVGGENHRAWVWSAFVGLKKEYKFWGNVKGNAQLLYNLYDDHDNSPYGDRVIVRMGFEFPMPKSKR